MSSEGILIVPESCRDKDCPFTNDLLWQLCQKSISHGFVEPFLGSLFYFINLFAYLVANTTLP
jgi:hypothetical protein